MCAVSMITDVYGRLGQTPIPHPVPSLNWPTTLPTALPWTPDAFAMLKEVLAKVDALDKKLGLAECEDPKKAEWMKAIEERLRILENSESLV